MEPSATRWSAWAILRKGPSAAVRKGKLILVLKGKKLKGQWTLVRMRRSDENTKNAWLLIKTEADMRPISARADDRSVQSGRTMKQIAAASDQIWQSNRTSRQATAPRPAQGSGMRRASRPRSRR